MEMTKEEFYASCSTPYLQNLIDTWDIPGENKRIIEDVLETRKEEESK
jgi:hypothetical protein